MKVKTFPTSYGECWQLIKFRVSPDVNVKPESLMREIERRKLGVIAVEQLERPPTVPSRRYDITIPGQSTVEDYHKAIESIEADIVDAARIKALAEMIESE